ADKNVAGKKNLEREQHEQGEERPAASAEELFDDLAGLLQKRQPNIIED
ncbi:MAG: hypothetical protein HN430_05330, partial [Halieaceae bacterium]|nr:hypothetical protein [Halieaceae bacterium]